MFASASPPRALAQGCVAVRNNPTSLIIPGDFADTIVTANRWIGSVAYRWFESGRHFMGDVEQPQFQRQGTQVINDVHTFDIAATYGITERWSATIDFPFLFADRSSKYEHDLRNRHSMHASGLGDIRLVTDFWLFNPHQHMDGNIALGAGFKAPTGDDKASDIAYRGGFTGSGPVYRPVDPSIQPGDGGWGIILELQAYQKILKNLFAYVNGSYLMAPQEKNHTEYTIADVPLFSFITPDMKYNTIPDQYFGRGGFSYVIWPDQGLTLSIGARIEGIPVHDVVGGSMGFRRPGYTISVEPGLSWSHKKNSLSITAPVAMYRNREPSAPEMAAGQPGGDASFADYSILASFTHRF